MWLLADQGQMRVAVACLYLDPDITLSAVQKLVPPHVASANRVAAAIKVMRWQQALIPCASHDRRVRRYRLSGPATALLEDFIMMMVGAGSPFTPTAPDRRRCRAWCEDFLFATLERGAGRRSSIDAERGQTLRGGALLNLELSRRGLEPDDQLPFSRRAFAAQFGLSRAQVIALVGQLERTGWATLVDRRLQPTALAMEAGRAWLGRFMAISTAVLDEQFRDITARSRAQIEAARAAAAPDPAISDRMQASAP